MTGIAIMCETFSVIEMIGYVLLKQPGLKINKLLRSLIVSSIATCIVFFNAQAAQSDWIHLTQLTGRTVKVCLAQADNHDICKVVRMPVEGEVERIVQGAWLSSDYASWLALGKRRAAICAYDQTNTVTCEPMQGSGELRKYTVSLNDGLLQISVANPQAQDDTPDSTRRFTDGFARAADDARYSLQSKLRERIKNAQAGGTRSAQVPTAVDLEDDNGDDSADTNWGGVDIGGITGEVGGDFGGGIDFGTTCVAGPAIVCVRGTSPPPPDFPATGLPPEAWTGSTPTGDSGGAYTFPPKQPPLDCKKVKDNCLQRCSDRTLPTPPKNDGWNFVNCVNQCMDESGCPR